MNSSIFLPLKRVRKINAIVTKEIAPNTLIIISKKLKCLYGRKYCTISIIRPYKDADIIVARYGFFRNVLDSL